MLSKELYDWLMDADETWYMWDQKRPAATLVYDCQLLDA